MQKYILSILILFGFMYTNSNTISPTHKAIKYSGRISFLNPEIPEFNHSGVRIRTCFEGTSISAKFQSKNDINYFLAIIDETEYIKFAVDTVEQNIQIAENLDNKLHTLEIIKITESIVGNALFYGFTLDKDAQLQDKITQEDKLIHFIGNSITCGYGIEVDNPELAFSPETENFYDAYACISARALGADYNIVSRSGIGIYRNYDDPKEGSKECMPVIYDRMYYDNPEVKYNYSEIKPDVICINLGTNDFSTIGADIIRFRKNYTEFLDRIRSYYPAAKIVCLIGPMLNTDIAINLLTSIVDNQKQKGDKEIYFFEMSAQGKLGYGADWHPSRKQARKNAEELANYLSSLTGWEAGNISQSIDFEVKVLEPQLTED